MRLYADAAALTAYPGGSTVPTGDVDALLRTASRLVDRLLVGRVYDVDPTTELPTDPDVAQALSDAVCAIAVEANATGALKPGATQEYASVGIGNVSLSGRTSSEGTLVLDGIPVPAAALSALSSVGDVYVTTAPTGYVRPLFRIAP